MSGSTNYKYRPLRHPDAIRLCRLLPHSNVASFIHISLSSYRLSDPNLKFTALSYTWGGPSEKVKVSVGGRDAFLQVPRSAGEALTALRRYGKEKLFWIDAICIDQSNLQEKTSQVRIMGRIFARAFSTVIYLGPHTESSQIVFRELIEARNAPKVKAKWRNKMLLDRAPPNGAVVQGLEELIQRPWFQRVWVLQEAFLSRNIWVLCGDSMVPKEVLLGCLFGYANSTLVTKQNAPFALRVDEEFMSISTHPSWYNFWGCLYDTRGSLATDSRDKLFALRALFAPLEENDMDSFVIEFDKMIDYEKSLEEVFETLALTLLQFVGLWLLVGARHEHNRDMPSWVPDWSQNLPLHRHFFTQLKCYKAYRRLVNRAISTDYQLLDSHILNVQGWRCGQIEEMGETYLFATTEDAGCQLSRIISLIIDKSSETVHNEATKLAEVGLTQSILKVLRKMDRDEIEGLLTRSCGSWGPIEELSDIPLEAEQARYVESALHNCRIVLCEPSYIAIAPCSAMEGDILVIVEGAPSPCLVRPSLRGTWHVVSGDCYAVSLDPLISLENIDDDGYEDVEETWKALRTKFGDSEVFCLS